MYIGLLEQKRVSYCCANSNLDFPPSAVEDGVTVWNWDRVFNVPFDVNIDFGKSSYIGVLCTKIERGHVTRLEVLVNGEICGCYAAETGKSFDGEVSIPVETVGDSLTLRIYPYLEAVGLAMLDVLGAQNDGKPMVWPTPKNIEYGEKCLQIGKICPASDDEDELFVAKFLEERLEERFGKDFFQADGECVVIKKEDFKDERYTVTVREGNVVLSGGKRISMLYAADTFVQVATRAGVLEFTCDDKPEKELRGFHCGLPTLENFEFARRFFRYVLLPLRYNLLFIQVSGGMEYKKHPEINEGYVDVCAKVAAGEMPLFPHIGMIADGTVLTQEQVKTYISFARELGFEIVPEVQSLGHVQYITYSHPEIAEISEDEVVVEDVRLADMPPAAVYPHCYCPSLEESYNIIFDILDEVIEVFKPDRYVHIGHDEIYKIGVCKRCKGKNPSDILLEHVTRLYNYIKDNHGLHTAMWADMLHPAPTTRYLTSDRRADFPKDILMLDFIWYFNFDQDIEDELLPYGYKMLIGNLYSSHFARYTSRIMKENVIGGQISTWRKLDEFTLAENGKIWDAMFLSEMLWNPSKYDERNRATYSYILATKIQPEMRDHLRGLYCIEGYEKTELALPESKKKLPPPVRYVAPDTFVFTDETIAVGEKFDRLVFEHATDINRPRILRRPFVKCGEYTVTYEDGETVSIPVCYASNILCYDCTYGNPLPQKYYRHNGYICTWLVDPAPVGKDFSGKPVNFFAYVWENPRPGVKIEHVSYKAVEDGTANLLVRKILGCNKRG
ncbi:MAG: hypothetical protein E7609_03985 [Ruminococcaceae bacterium]|nr:hypothetical protein [Oscillospiraceae bacterium]